MGERKVVRDIRWGLKRSLAVAAVYSAWVFGISLVKGREPFDRVGMSLSGVLAAYFIAAVIVGITFGFLRPFARTSVGAHLVAAVAGLPAGMALTVALAGMPNRWNAGHWIGVGFVTLMATALIGPPLAKAHADSGSD